MGDSMVRVSAVELQRKMGHVQDLALLEPVTITNNGRDRIVMMSASEYHRLKRRDRKVMALAHFTEADIAALERVQPSPAAIGLNHELGD